MELSRREKAIILIATDRHNVHERAFQSREMVGEHSSSWGQPASVIYLAFPHTHTRPYIHRNTYTHFLRRYVGACVCVCECVSRSLPHSTHSIAIINFPVELPTFSNIKASFTHHSQYLGLLLDKKTHGAQYYGWPHLAANHQLTSSPLDNLPSVPLDFYNSIRTSYFFEAKFRPRGQEGQQWQQRQQRPCLFVSDVLSLFFQDQWDVFSIHRHRHHQRLPPSSSYLK